MQFQTPQFIEIEDKIFGPFTFKQFLYLGGGGGIAYGLWALLPPLIAIVLIVPLVGLALALAFYKVNNRPFAFLLESYIKYFFKTKLYLWHKRQAPKKEKPKNDIPKPGDPVPEDQDFTDSKLKNLAWSLDVLDVEQRG